MKAEILRELAKYNCSMCGRAQEIMDKGICAPSCMQEFKLDEKIEKELEELEDKADKWDEKETPYKPKEVKKYNSNTLASFCGWCKCESPVLDTENYCSNCGQKLDWESEGE